ncbi:macrophage migration inhibitory factor-like [Saccostrea echinata]|uniref:macrophage migration inhibitory factor-like n=1 Tax=Saccostrea echinata TaxID=191078 RepID=UPI002A82CA26|nr:macrophage migration inhibitory factor-like [Saccostrea echinata]
MPTFAVYTNLSKDKIPKDFLQQACAFVAKELDKPEHYVIVRVHADPMMCIGMSSDPCASIEVKNITDGAKNKEHAVNITNFVESTLNIPKDRFFITFTNLRKEEVALNGKTFA